MTPEEVKAEKDENPRYIIEWDDDKLTPKTIESIRAAWYAAYGDTRVLVVPRGVIVKRIDTNCGPGDVEIVGVPLTWFERLRAGLADWFRWQ